MANQFSTGAVHVFVGNRTGTPAYLGTCETMPQDTRQPEYEMLMNDISGSKVPLDVSFQGESAQISLILTRLNYPACLNLESKPRPSLSLPGQWSWNDVGTLQGFEGFALQLWLVYTFGAGLANKAAYVSNGMPAGRHYPQCVVWAPETEETGSRPMKKHFLFYAWPLAIPAQRRFVLYDFNFAGINAGMIT